MPLLILLSRIHTAAVTDSGEERKRQARHAEAREYRSRAHWGTLRRFSRSWPRSMRRERITAKPITPRCTPTPAPPPPLLPPAQRGQPACHGILCRSRAPVQRDAPAPRRRRTDFGDRGVRTPLRCRAPPRDWAAPRPRPAAPALPPRDAASAARIARIASGSWTVAINRSRPPQRGHASTSRPKARRISAAHAQWRGADFDVSLASEHGLATAGGVPQGCLGRLFD